MPRAARPRAGPALAVAVLAVGVVLRFLTPSALWIDEALSVNIARLPLGQLPAALRQDGSPPLYYALLHGWMRLVGGGDVAVRALSGLFSLVALPLVWRLGQRVGGRRVAWGAVLLLASSPFAVRYATEARMYALLMALVLAGALAVLAAFDDERPSLRRLAPVAVVTAALLYTHYWSLYLLVAAGAVVARHLRRPHREAAARRVLGAMAVGGVAFLPWVPVFLFQAAHTGTPWAARPDPSKVVVAMQWWAGGPGAASLVLLALLVSLAWWGARRPTWWLTAVVAGTLGVALVAAVAGNAAYVPRYTGVVVPLFLVLAAAGAWGPGRRALAGAVALGVVLSAVGAVSQRTQAPEVARAIERYGAPGDVVVYCPDQLGPATDRLLAPGFRQVTFPDGGRPERVDWVDYQARNEAGDPMAFARQVLAQAGDARIFVVWSGQYRTFGWKCQRLVRTLELSRPSARLVRRDFGFYERMWLTAFPARPPA